jgi:hypothetical protein
MGRVSRQKRRFKRDFYIKDYSGSWEAARKAARRWEKAMEKSLPPKIPTKGLMTTRNRSGVVGVHLKKEIQKKRYVYWKWTARWPNSPRHGGLTWSTVQFSDDDAFVLAVLSRRMESIDRPRIIAELDKVKGTEEYHEMLSLKKQSPP